MDWKVIREEYEQSNITLKELAAKYGVSEGTMRSRKNREKWQRNATDNATQRATKKENVATSKEISWVDIENEYVTDVRKKPCTLKGLANKYSIPFKTIMDFSTKNKWKEKRKKHHGNIKEKTATKAAEYISSDVAKTIAKHYRISDKLIDVVEKVLADDHELYRHVEKLRTSYGPGDFKDELATEVLDAINDSKLLNIVNALEKIQKMQRQTLGIIDEKDKQKAELEQAKFDIDKAKVTGSSGIEANNERILTLANLLNNPVPNRNVEDFEEDDEPGGDNPS